MWAKAPAKSFSETSLKETTDLLLLQQSAYCEWIAMTPEAVNSMYYAVKRDQQ